MEKHYFFNLSDKERIVMTTKDGVITKTESETETNGFTRYEYEGLTIDEFMSTVELEYEKMEEKLSNRNKQIRQLRNQI